VFIVTEKWFYYRLATQDEVDVPRIYLNSGMAMLTPAAGLQYTAYRNGNRDLPSTLSADLKWEEEWLDAVLKRTLVDKSGWSIAGLPVFSAASSSLACSSTDDPFGVAKATQAAVKLEPGLPRLPNTPPPRSFSRQLVGQGVGEIDLSSSPSVEPPRKKMAYQPSSPVPKVAVDVALLESLAEADGEALKQETVKTENVKKEPITIPPFPKLAVLDPIEVMDSDEETAMLMQLARADRLRMLEEEDGNEDTMANVE
jgi:hypothetical protein